ncbi:MAG: NAD(P)-dependent oxidoreductase [Bacilli bacterium]
MKLGFIGLGTMGLPMMKRLLDYGYEVFVVSRSRGPIEQALSWGAKEARHPADLASKVEIVFTCLPMPDVIEDVYLGVNGIFEGAKPGLIAVDHSTVSPALNRLVADALQTKGTQYLDAPISGGPMGAKAGTLAIMVGGEAEIYERVLPAFEAMGSNVFYIGPIGSGSVVKLINNMLVGVHTSALSEAFVMGQKANLDPALLHQVLKVSTGHSKMIDRCIDLIQDRDFKQRFSIDLLYKDMGIAQKLAEELNVPIPLGIESTKMIGRAQTQGFGKEDISAAIKPVESEAGVIVKRREGANE